MLRFKSNCRVTLVVPRLLDDVISVMPAILPNWRSKVVATEEAMISVLAPGKLAPTEIVGKSICGSGETGNSRKATAPARAMAAVRRAVATGRRINGEERLISINSALIRGDSLRSAFRRTVRRITMREPVEEDVNDRSRVERKHLTQEQAAHHGDAQGTTEFRTNSSAEGEWQAGQQRGHGGHHDRTETQEARFINSVFRSLVLFALRIQSEVDHHDSVLFDDTDQKDDSDEGDDAEFLAANQQGQNRTHPGGGQSRQDCDGVYVALVENAEHDINRDQGGENQ